MTTETALPTGDTAAASESTEAQVVAAAEPTESTATTAEGQTEGSEKEQAKPEKTPEQREIDRLRRRVDNLTRQKYELRAAAPQPAQPPTQVSDDEPVTLSRAELQKLIAEQAQQLAPTVNQQQAEIERRQGVVSSLAKDWGQEEFDAKAEDLDHAFGGLTDRSGRPKPATDAIFYADDPRSVIEYLTDPDHADEAERLSKLSAVQAGREIARLEGKLSADKAKAKPQASNAPRPLEAVKGGGVASKDPAQMTDKEFASWRRNQIAQRR